MCEVNMANDWTITELAQKAGLSTGHIRYLILSGTLKATKRANTWFVGDAEVRRWLDDRAKNPPKTGPKPGSKLRRKPK